MKGAQCTVEFELSIMIVEGQITIEEQSLSLDSLLDIEHNIRVKCSAKSKETKLISTSFSLLSI
jgi:hypothetical protein